MSGAAVMPTSDVLSILTAKFLKPCEVAAVLKLSRKALADMRLERAGPPFTLKARGVVVYPAESFIQFLRARSQKECRGTIGAREARWSRAKGLNGRQAVNEAAHYAARSS